MTVPRTEVKKIFSGSKGSFCQRFVIGCKGFWLLVNMKSKRAQLLGQLDVGSLSHGRRKSEAHAPAAKEINSPA